MKLTRLIVAASIVLSGSAFAMAPSAAVTRQQANEVIIPPSASPAAFHPKPQGDWVIPPAVSKAKPQGDWVIPPAVVKAKPQGDWVIPPAGSKTSVKPMGDWVIPPASN